MKTIPDRVNDYLAGTAAPDLRPHHGDANPHARPLNVLLAGQRRFGADVFKSLRSLPGVACAEDQGRSALAGTAIGYGAATVAMFTPGWFRMFRQV